MDSSLIPNLLDHSKAWYNKRKEGNIGNEKQKQITGHLIAAENHFECQTRKQKQLDLHISRHLRAEDGGDDQQNDCTRQN